VHARARAAGMLETDRIIDHFSTCCRRTAAVWPRSSSTTGRGAFAFAARRGITTCASSARDEFRRPPARAVLPRRASRGPRGGQHRGRCRGGHRFRLPLLGGATAGRRQSRAHREYQVNVARVIAERASRWNARRYALEASRDVHDRSPHLSPVYFRRRGPESTSRTGTGSMSAVVVSSTPTRRRHAQGGAGAPVAWEFAAKILRSPARPMSWRCSRRACSASSCRRRTTTDADAHRACAEPCAAWSSRST
jgi:hypothetical protein